MNEPENVSSKEELTVIEESEIVEEETASEENGDEAVCISETEKTDERKGKRPFSEKFFDCVPKASFVFFIIGAVAAILHVSFCLSAPFADFFNGTVSAAFRFVLAKLTSVYPASLFEFILICAPITIFLVLRAVWHYVDRHPRHGFIRSFFAVLSVAVLMYSLFVFDFAAGYRTTKLPERMGIAVAEVNKSQLYSVTLTVVDRLNAAVPDVTFEAGGASVMPYSHSECVKRVTAAYDEVSKEYPFIRNFSAPVKRIALSPVMTYTHISGVYSFFTGEANLNTNYPDFVNVFSLAHEMAHQRGIAREDEANFVAYLVLTESSDPYLRYCGYMNMYEYLADALYNTSKTLWSQAAGKLSDGAIGELRAYSSFFAEYRESQASKAAEKMNDSYLHVQGTEGTKSYGMVVDLAVAYHLAGN